MLGALIGDIAGSIYEWRNCKSKDFPLVQPGCRMTDDSVMTAAVASAVSLAAQRRFYQCIVSRELKRQLGPLREQLDEIQAENRQLRRELLKVEEEVQENEPETPEA